MVEKRLAQFTFQILVGNTLPDAPLPSKVCLKCGYPLDHLIRRQCPECGRPFDPNRANTYRNPQLSMGGFGHIAGTGLIAFAVYMPGIVILTPTGYALATFWAPAIFLLTWLHEWGRQSLWVCAAFTLAIVLLAGAITSRSRLACIVFAIMLGSWSIFSALFVAIQLSR